MTHNNDHDTTGKDILREHVKSILNEACGHEDIYEDVDLTDDALSIFTDAIIDGLGIHPIHVSKANVVISGLYNRGER